MIRSSFKNFYFWWFATLFIKFFLVTITPLSTDENYYWVWSQNLQLSYYDHPPMVAWLFAIGNFLPAFMLKWPAIVMGHLSFLIWNSFLKNIQFNENQRMVFFILALFCPLVGLSALALTPDLPLLFFISLSVYTFQRALSTPKIFWYILFGLSLGVGFTSKYHIVLIIPGMLLFLLKNQSYKKVLPVGVLLTIIFFLVGSSPVLIWNYLNNWISFKFQINHGLNSNTWNNSWPLEFITSQIFIITPLFLYDLFTKNELKSFNDEKSGLKTYSWNFFFLIISLPIFTFFIINAFKHKVEANWTQVAFPFVLSFLAQKKINPLKIKIYSFFWGILLSVIITQWKYDWWKNPPSEKLIEPTRFVPLIKEMQIYKPFYVSSYQMASFLWYNTHKPVYKIYQMSRIDFFDYFQQSKPKERPFYIAKLTYTEPPAWFEEEQLSWKVIKTMENEIEIVKVDDKNKITKENTSE